MPEISVRIYISKSFSDSLKSYKKKSYHEDFRKDFVKSKVHTFIIYTK